jgi:hypothetical protein
MVSSGCTLGKTWKEDYSTNRRYSVLRQDKISHEGTRASSRFTLTLGAWNVLYVYIQHNQQYYSSIANGCSLALLGSFR